MNSLLTRGLRNERLHGDKDWCDVVTRVIQGQWPAPTASPQTLEAEQGLGILGKPYYFYVLRAEESYGLVVFVLSEVEGSVWPAGAKGATPFDSGGWWLKLVRTNPPLSTAARQEAFRTLDVPLQDWQGAFERYLKAHYQTLGDYIDGRAPRLDSPTKEAEFTIIKGPPNAARAWTWEVRIPYNLVADRLTPRAAYMAEETLVDYSDWLDDCPLLDSQSRRIRLWVRDHVMVPKQDHLVVRAVRESMAMEAAGD